MAYYLTYRVAFNNALTENCVLNIYKKDVEPDSVIDLTGINCSKKATNGNGDKFDTIISQELSLSLWLNGSVSPFDLLVSFHDEWKVVLTLDEMIEYVGFLVPSEGGSSFLDKPVQVDLTATDCLGYLKSIDFTKLDGGLFEGVNFLYEYIIAALSKTNLDIGLRIYCNIYEISMQDRTASNNADMFNQSALDYRTFKKDASTFMYCYDVLNTILSEGFSLYQWKGQWVILRIGEMQTNVGPVIWYTEYSSTGEILSGYIDEFDPTQIKKDQILHPINADAVISAQFAIKSAKHTYNYNVWDELPLNNKFDRGSYTGGNGPAYDKDANGDDTSTQIGTYKDWTIDDWVKGTMFAGPTAIANLPVLPANFDPIFRRSTYNFYGTEILREIVINKTTAQTQVSQCLEIPVRQGDKLNIGFDFRLSYNYNDQLRIQAVSVYIKPASGGNPYWWRDGAGISNAWRRNGAATEAIYIEYADNTEHTKVYKSKSLDSPPIPEDGTLYIQLLNVLDDGLPNATYFKNFEFTYYPYIAGGYVQVKGDYWFTSQNKSYYDIVDEDVSISDSPVKLFKGALLRTNKRDLTLSRNWARLGVGEGRDFKEFTNLSRYNAAMRRTLQINGSFGGTQMYPDNGAGNRFPLCFHKHFYFPDSSDLAGTYFMLVPPYTIDYVGGKITATFVECFEEGSDDGNNANDVHEFKYIF